MTIQYSISLRNARLESDEVIIGVTPKLRMYSGSVPANCAATIGAAVQLAEMALPSDWMAAASAGSKAKLGTWQDVAADASGTFSFYRIWDSAGTTCHEQGTLGLSGTDMTVDSASVTAGQTVTVTGYTKTASGA